MPTTARSSLAARPTRPNLHLVLLCSESDVDVTLAARVLKHTLHRSATPAKTQRRLLSLTQTGTAATPTEAAASSPPLTPTSAGATAGGGGVAATRTASRGSSSHNSRRAADGISSSTAAPAPNASPEEKQLLQSVRQYIVKLERAAALRDGVLSMEEVEAQEQEDDEAANSNNNNNDVGGGDLASGRTAAAAKITAVDGKDKKEAKNTATAGHGSGTKKRTGSGSGSSSTRQSGKKITTGGRAMSLNQQTSGGGSGSGDGALSSLAAFPAEAKRQRFLQEYLPDCELVELAPEVRSDMPGVGSGECGDNSQDGSGASPIVFLYRLHNQEALIEADASATNTSTTTTTAATAAGTGSPLATAGDGGAGLGGQVDWEESLWQTLEPALLPLGERPASDLVVVWAVADPRMLRACTAKPELLLRQGRGNSDGGSGEEVSRPASPFFSAATAAGGTVAGAAVPDAAKTKKSLGTKEASQAAPSPTSTAAASHQQQQQQQRLWQRHLHPRLILYLNEHGFVDRTVPGDTTPRGGEEEDGSGYFFPKGSSHGKAAATGGGTGAASAAGPNGRPKSTSGPSTSSGKGPGSKGNDGAANTATSATSAASDTLLRDLATAADDFAFFHHRHSPRYIDRILYTCDSFHDFVAKEQRFQFQKRYVQRQREAIFPFTAAISNDNARYLEGKLLDGIAQEEGKSRCCESRPLTTEALGPSACPLEQWMANHLQHPPTLTDFGTYLVERRAYHDAVAAAEERAGALLQQQQARLGRRGSAQQQRQRGVSAQRATATGKDEAAAEGEPSSLKPISAVECLAAIMSQGPRGYADERVERGDDTADAGEGLRFFPRAEPVWHVTRFKTPPLGGQPDAWVAACARLLQPMLGNLSRLVHRYSDWYRGRVVSTIPAIAGMHGGSSCTRQQQWGNSLSVPPPVSAAPERRDHHPRCVSAAALRRMNMDLRHRSGSDCLAGSAVYEREKKVLGRHFTVLSATQALVGQVATNLSRQEPLRLVKPADQSSAPAALTLPAANTTGQWCNPDTMTMTADSAGGGGGGGGNGNPSAGDTRAEQESVVLAKGKKRRVLFRPYSSAARPDGGHERESDGLLPAVARGDAAGTSSVLLSDASGTRHDRHCTSSQAPAAAAAATAGIADSGNVAAAVLSDAKTTCEAQKEEAAEGVAEARAKWFALPADHTQDRPRPLPFPQEIHWLVQQYVKKSLGSYRPRAGDGDDVDRGQSGTGPSASPAASADAEDLIRRKAAAALRRMAELQGEQCRGTSAAEAVQEEEERLVKAILTDAATDVAPALVSEIHKTTATEGVARSSLTMGELLEHHARRLATASIQGVFPASGTEARMEELQEAIFRSLARREKEHILQQTLLALVADAGGLLLSQGTTDAVARAKDLDSTRNAAAAAAAAATVEEKVSLVVAASRIAAFRQRFGHTNTALVTLYCSEIDGSEVSHTINNDNRSPNQSGGGGSDEGTSGQTQPSPRGKLAQPTSHFSATAENVYPPRRAKQVWVCGLKAGDASAAATVGTSPQRVRHQLWVHPWQGVLSLPEHAACVEWLAATPPPSTDENAVGSTTLPLAVREQLMRALVNKQAVTLPAFPSGMSSSSSSPPRTTGSRVPFHSALHALHLAGEGRQTFYPFTNALVELTTTHDTRTCRYIHESDIVASLHYHIPKETPEADGGTGKGSTTAQQQHQQQRYVTFRYDDGVSLTVTSALVPCLPPGGSGRDKAAPTVTINAFASDLATDDKRGSYLVSPASPSVRDGMPTVLTVAEEARRATALVLPSKPNEGNGGGGDGEGGPPHVGGRGVTVNGRLRPGLSRGAGGRSMNATNTMSIVNANNNSTKNKSTVAPPDSSAAADAGLRDEDELLLLRGLPVRRAAEPFTAAGDVRLWVANHSAPDEAAAVAATTTTTTTVVECNVAVTTNCFVLRCHDAAEGEGVARTPDGVEGGGTTATWYATPHHHNSNNPRQQQPSQTPASGTELHMSYFNPAPLDSGLVAGGSHGLSTVLPQVETLLCVHGMNDEAAQSPLLPTREREVRRVAHAATGTVVRYFASGNSQALFADGAVLTAFHHERGEAVDTLVAPSGRCYARSSPVKSFVPLHHRFDCCRQRVDDAGSESLLVSRQDGVCSAYYPLSPAAGMADLLTADCVRVVLHADGTTITSFPANSSWREGEGGGPLRLCATLRPLMDEVDTITDFMNASSLPGPKCAVRWTVESPRMPRMFLCSLSKSAPGRWASQRHSQPPKAPFYVSFGDGTALARRPTALGPVTTTDLTTTARPPPATTTTTASAATTTEMQWETIFARPSRTQVRLFHAQHLAMLESADVLARHAASGYQRRLALAVSEGCPVFDLARGGLRLVDNRRHVLTVDKMFTPEEDVVADMSAEPVGWEDLLRQLVAPEYNPHRISKRRAQEATEVADAGGTRGPQMIPSSMRWKSQYRRGGGGGVACPDGDTPDFPPLLQRLRVLGEAFITGNGLLRPEVLRRCARAEEERQSGVVDFSFFTGDGDRQQQSPQGPSASPTRVSTPECIGPLSYVQLVCGDVLQFSTEAHAQQAIRSAASESLLLTAMASANGVSGHSRVAVRGDGAEVRGMEQLFLYRAYSGGGPADARRTATATAATATAIAAAATAPGVLRGAGRGAAEDPTSGAESATTLSRYAQRQQELLSFLHSGTSPAAFRARGAHTTAIRAAPGFGASSYWLPPTLQPPPLHLSAPSTTTTTAAGGGGVGMLGSDTPWEPTPAALRVFYRVRPVQLAVHALVLAEAIARQRRLSELCAYHAAVTTLPVTAATTKLLEEQQTKEGKADGPGALPSEDEDDDDGGGEEKQQGAAAAALAAEEQATHAAARAEQRRLRQLYYTMKEQVANS